MDIALHLGGESGDVVELEVHEGYLGAHRLILHPPQGHQHALHVLGGQEDVGLQFGVEGVELEDVFELGSAGAVVYQHSRHSPDDVIHEVDGQ